MKRLLIILIFILALSINVKAWDCQTHQYLTENYLLSNYPTCKNEIDNGSCYPDSTIKDFVKHHCQDNLPNCSAKIRYQEELSKANSLNGCDKSFQLAVAYHYLEDSNCPAHHYSLESNDHSKFEDCINNHIIKQDAVWNCDYTFIDKTNITRTLHMDNNLLINKVKDVTPISNQDNPFNIFIQKLSDIIKQMIETIKGLF